MPYSATWSDHLGPDHCDALTHLVAGLTDHASAHRLGVSERTVQRRVRELMDWSGSGNRMQLGHRAALAGLPAAARLLPRFPCPAEPSAGCVPDAAALRLLRLLLADAAAERLLNLSTSSVERRLRELMNLAQARSRAQLGWLATQWGWLEAGSSAADSGAGSGAGSAVGSAVWPAPRQAQAAQAGRGGRLVSSGESMRWPMAASTR